MNRLEEIDASYLQHGLSCISDEHFDSLLFIGRHFEPL